MRSTTPAVLLRLFRAEFSKLVRAGYTWVVVAGTAAVAAGLDFRASSADNGGVSGSSSASLHALAGSLTYASAHLGSVSEVTAAFLGILFLTDEYAARTWTTTLVLAPRRGRLIGVKLAVVAVAGVALSALATLFAILGGWIGMDAFAPQLASHVQPEMFVAAAGQVGPVILATLLVGMFWTAIAFLVRQRVGVIVGYTAYAIIGTNGPVLGFPWLARWLPEGAAQAITPPALMLSIHWKTAFTLPLSTSVAVPYLLVLAMAAVVVAVVAGLRQDIS